MTDAVVIGAGPNGLVAGNVLADAGWSVVVLEAQPQPGGAVKSGELTGLPGFTHDLFSSFYPLAVASPPMRALELERWGVRWCQAPLVVAHPTRDGSCVSISRDLDETCESLDRFAPGDGDAWRRLYRIWERVGDDLLDALLGTPFPPVRAGTRLALSLRRDLVRFLRFALLPVRTLSEHNFRGDGGKRLLAGNALHADFAPEAAGSGIYGWLLASLGQQFGWPVPEGGAGELTAALVRRLEARGGELVLGAHVTEVLQQRGKAVAARCADGREFGARRAVLADVEAGALYRDMIGRPELMREFDRDPATVKVDWALDAPIPWIHPDARRAGTLHIGEGIDALTVHASELARKLLPSEPFMLMGQYSMTDPTRQPDGRDTAWAYTHVPHTWDERDAEAFVQRMEAQVEALAPGFGDLIRARHVFTPRKFQEQDANLIGGALNGGTAQIHQQLVFRPTPGTGRPETPVKNLYLASFSAHPGGGVHGSCGANAARAALRT